VYRLTACLTHEAENSILAVCVRQRQLLLFVDGNHAHTDSVMFGSEANTCDNNVLEHDMDVFHGVYGHYTCIKIAQSIKNQNHATYQYYLTQ